MRNPFARKQQPDKASTSDVLAEINAFLQSEGDSSPFKFPGVPIPYVKGDFHFERYMSAALLHIKQANPELFRSVMKSRDFMLTTDWAAALAHNCPGGLSNLLNFIAEDETGDSLRNLLWSCTDCDEVSIWDSAVVSSDEQLQILCKLNEIMNNHSDVRSVRFHQAAFHRALDVTRKARSLPDTTRTREYLLELWEGRVNAATILTQEDHSGEVDLTINRSYEDGNPFSVAHPTVLYDILVLDAICQTDEQFERHKPSATARESMCCYGGRLSEYPTALHKLTAEQWSDFSLRYIKTVDEFCAESEETGGIPNLVDFFGPEVSEHIRILLKDLITQRKVKITAERLCVIISEHPGISEVAADLILSATEQKSDEYSLRTLLTAVL